MDVDVDLSWVFSGMADGGDLNFHDEVELEDFEWDAEEKAWYERQEKSVEGQR